MGNKSNPFKAEETSTQVKKEKLKQEEVYQESDSYKYQQQDIVSSPAIYDQKEST